jgi:hypothetical protein
VNGDGNTVGVSDAHNRGADASAGADSSNLGRTSVRNNGRRVNERVVRSQAGGGGGSSAPDAGSVSHAIGSASAGSNTRRTEEVLVVVVVLAMVLSMTEAGDSNGRASKSQDGELGVDRRHLFKSGDEKDKKNLEYLLFFERA